MQNGGVYVNGPQAVSTAPAAGTILGGDNGLSRSTVTPTFLVLGDDVGTLSGLANLLSDREINTQGFFIELFKFPLTSERLHLTNQEVFVGDTTKRLAITKQNWIYSDFVTGTSTEFIFSQTAGVDFLLVQLGGANSGYLLDLTNGRMCIGNNVVPPEATLHLLAGVVGSGGAPFLYTAGAAAQTVLKNGAKNFNGTNEFLTAGGVNYTMAKTLTATAALNFPNTLPGTSSDLTIALTGAALGDIVMLGVPNASTVANGCFTAWVSAPNTITVRFTNNDLLAAFDPASGTFRVAIVKY